MSETIQQAIQDGINALQHQSHLTALSKGWWDSGDRNFGEMIALMHSELSEALEEYRVHGLDETAMLYYSNGSKPEGIAAEFADVLIRIADVCGRYNIPLAEAVIRKMEYNATRPYRHGNKHA